MSQWLDVTSTLALEHMRARPLPYKEPGLMMNPHGLSSDQQLISSCVGWNCCANRPQEGPITAVGAQALETNQAGKALTSCCEAHRRAYLKPCLKAAVCMR